MKDKRDRYEIEMNGTFSTEMRLPADNFNDARNRAIEIINNIGRKKKIKFKPDVESILVAQIVKKPRNFKQRTVWYDEDLLKEVFKDAFYNEQFKQRIKSQQSGGMLLDREIKNYETKIKELTKLAKAFGIEINNYDE